ncbi:hypothetical protein LCGC14_0600950 [marine sediment metagenome]|uniref:Uncharacterized protein n=1 Tax=marine sediment metagenome TaxID=412755 RepID=A0A0F9RFB8_9ZZZZ
MPKYNITATINLTVDANNQKWARAAVNGVLKGYWWRNADIGFIQSRYRIDCDKVKINNISKGKT